MSCDDILVALLTKQMEINNALKVAVADKRTKQSKIDNMMKQLTLLKIHIEYYINKSKIINCEHTEYDKIDKLYSDQYRVAVEHYEAI